jgi:ATP-binding cassette subfamily B protein
VSYRWLAGFVAPHKVRLGAVAVLSLVAGIMSLAQPYLTKILIDDGLIARRFDTVIAVCGVMLSLGLAGAVLNGVNRWHYVTASGRILFALRTHVYRHLQRLSPAYYARMRVGDLMARLDGDVAEVQRFSVDSALALLSSLIGLIGAVAFMVSLSLELSLLAFVLVPAQMLFLRVVRPRIETMTRTLRERAGDVSSFLVDTLSAMKLVQSVGAEGREAGRLARLQDRYFDDMRRLQMTQYAAATIPGLLTLASTIVVFAIGGYWVIADALTIGTLVAFTAYLARAIGPVNSLLGLYVAFHRARVSLERVAEITRVEPDVAEPAQPQPLPDAAHSTLVLEGVSFRHQGGGEAVFEDVDAVFPAGRKIAVCGVSGAGKSTLIDLLQRHFDPSGGRILLGGVDLRCFDLGALRSHIAVVAQDTVLFAGSVLDNVRYAAPESTEDAVEEAIRLAQIDVFAKGLPQGLETEVGARGTKLSGGQRQRIAIARAILQAPAILVLDEATTGVDAATEQRIAEAVDTLFAGRTRIVISHHAHIARDADLVFQVAGGTLEELPKAGARP